MQSITLTTGEKENKLCLITGSSLGKICILTRHLNRQLITITKKLLTFGKTFTMMSFQTLKEKTNVVWED
jgi:hypothetical protein